MASQAEGLNSGNRGCKVSLTSVFISLQKRSMSLLAICTQAATVVIPFFYMSFSQDQVLVSYG